MSFIQFSDVGSSPSGKTRIYIVESKEEGFKLGYVKWHSAWRQYSFFPEAGTVLEKTCLRDIAEFCEEKTRKHRAGK